MFRIAAPTVLLSIALLTGCSSAPKAPDVSDTIRKALEQAGLKDVSVTQDREKGVVTLGGHVVTDADKANANQIARSVAADEVVANQVAVLPTTDPGSAKTVNSDLDHGIESNLEAALILNGYKNGIGHSVKNGVITLTGTVDTDAQRTQLGTIAQGVPNNLQVVNEIQTRHQKATSN